MKMLFKEPLQEGIILSRPNRFIMMVKHRNRTIKCHCPSTGRIGNIDFKNVPCLFSTASAKDRKTSGTVEAISLDSPLKKRKSWLGINQTAANRYIEFFSGGNSFQKMIGPLDKREIKREVTLGKSRIDFQIGKDYIEVKTPLTTMPFSNHVQQRSYPRFDSFDRIIKHFKDLARQAGKHKAILLMCYLYDAKPFRPPAPSKGNERIMKAAAISMSRGVEHWQANFRIDEKGVELLKYFRLKLF